jgi:membrane protein
MASLSDIKPVLRQLGIFGFIKKVWREMGEDHIFIYASALSYSWLFAFFPMLVFLLSLIPFLPDVARARSQQMIFDAIKENFPQQTAEWIMNDSKVKVAIQDALNNRRGALLSVSLVVALWAASNGISAVMTSLDRCYDVDKGRPYYRGKPLSVLLTVVLTALVLVVMTVIPIATYVERWLRHKRLHVPFTQIPMRDSFIVVFNLARYTIGLTAAFLILSIIYNFCPSVRMRWRLISPGAVFCFVAWVAIGLALRLYLNATGGTVYEQTFGPAAGLAMLLLTFYLYGVVLLIGAEINSEIDYLLLKVPPGTRDLRPYQLELKRRAQVKQTTA